MGLHETPQMTHHIENPPWQDFVSGYFDAAYASIRGLYLLPLMYFIKLKKKKTLIEPELIDGNKYTWEAWNVECKEHV